MPPKRTNSVHFSAAVPSPYNRSAPSIQNTPRLPWGAASPHSAQQSVKNARTRAEIIINEISTECTKLLGMNYKGKEEKAELEAHMQYLICCLQAAEQRAWKLEERVNTLEVEVAYRNVETPPTDQTAPPREI